MIELTGGATAIDRQMETLRTRVAALFDGADPADLEAFERVVAYVIPQVMTRDRSTEG
jgi:hypothetical protein